MLTSQVSSFSLPTRRIVFVGHARSTSHPRDRALRPMPPGCWLRCYLRINFRRQNKRLDGHTSVFGLSRVYILGVLQFQLEVMINVFVGGLGRDVAVAAAALVEVGVDPSLSRPQSFFLESLNGEW